MIRILDKESMSKEFKNLRLEVLGLDDGTITKLRKFLSDDPNVNITNIHRTGFMLEVND